jgi:hypothetical protein
VTLTVRPAQPVLADGAEAPRFRAETDAPYCRIEVTTDPLLFGAGYARRRRVTNFAESAARPSPVVDGVSEFRLPRASWATMRMHPRLFYRAFSYARHDAAPIEASVPEAQFDRAPWVLVGPRRTPAPPLVQDLSVRLPWLRVDGNRVVDESGATVVLRGVVRSGMERADRLSLDPRGAERYRSREAAGVSFDELTEVVRDWRANVVRLPLEQQWLLERIDYLYDVDRVVHWAAQLGAYTIVGLRPADPNDPARTLPLPDDNTLRAWRALASRYADQPAVLFDLFDEPRPPFYDDTLLPYAWRASDLGWRDLWHDWVRRLEETVHREHPRALLFVSGFPAGRSLRGFPVERGDGEALSNVVYAAHARDPAERSFEYDWGVPRLTSEHPIFVSAWGADASQRTWLAAISQTMRRLHRADAGGGWGGLAGWAAADWAGDPPLVEQDEAIGSLGRPYRRFTLVDGRRSPTAYGRLVQGELARRIEESAAEASVEPVLPPVRLAGAVGPALTNSAADVRRVQERLHELRYLSDAALAAETPEGDAVGALAETFASLKRLQADFGLAEDAKVGTANAAQRATLDALDRAIPLPTDEELEAVRRRLAAIAVVEVRGLALTAAVGNYSDSTVAAGTANRVADVRALQNRLVERGVLAANHGESPPQGATGGRKTSQLPRTIAAINHVQDQAKGWIGYDVGGTVLTGTTSLSRVRPTDATHQFLDRVTTYHVILEGRDLVFQSHPRRLGYPVPHPDGTAYVGSAQPSQADMERVGLTTAQAKALVAVSAAEGRYEALNTWDIAHVTLGFIQFAAGPARGLGPMLARTRGREPETFARLYGDYGIGIEYLAEEGRIIRERARWPSLALLVPGDPKRVLRGSAAEVEINRDRRFWGVLVTAGLDEAGQRLQAETAAREYALTAVGNPATHAETSAPISDLVTSELGMAIVIDRGVQENPMAGEPGHLRIVGALRAVAEREGLTDIREVAAHESDFIRQVIADLDADARIKELLLQVEAALATLKQKSYAAGSTVASVLAEPEAAAARARAAEAHALVPAKSSLTPQETSSWPFLTSRSGLDAALTTLEADLLFTPPPATKTALRQLLDQLIDRVSRRLVRKSVEELRSIHGRLEKLTLKALAKPPDWGP